MASTINKAAHSVLTDFDLVEDIILHLPIRDVLLSKRVCKSWKDVHDNSVRVQKALFLVPATEKTIFYPNHNKPTWYLLPDRDELFDAGLISDGEDSDVDATPTNSPVRRSMQKHASLAVLAAQVSLSESESTSTADGKAEAASNLELASPTPNKNAANKQKTSVSLDGKMPVSRVTRPFINPFCELFVERFFRGSRGVYHTVGIVFIPGVGVRPSGDVIVRPQIKSADGTVESRSPLTRAVQRSDASWRKMLPFSANTYRVQMECFEFGPLNVRLDNDNMLAGHLMDQLGEHWSTECPDCCIVDWWFAEFIRPVFLSNSSDWNRGDHGVQKLGLLNTGWDVLAKLNDAQVRTTGVKDRIRPL